MSAAAGLASPPEWYSQARRTLGNHRPMHPAHSAATRLLAPGHKSRRHIMPTQVPGPEHGRRRPRVPPLPPGRPADGVGAAPVPADRRGARRRAHHRGGGCAAGQRSPHARRRPRRPQRTGRPAGARLCAHCRSCEAPGPCREGCHCVLQQQPGLNLQAGPQVRCQLQCFKACRESCHCVFQQQPNLNVQASPQVRSNAHSSSSLP